MGKIVFACSIAGLCFLAYCTLTFFGINLLPPPSYDAQERANLAKYLALEAASLCMPQHAGLQCAYKVMLAEKRQLYDYEVSPEDVWEKGALMTPLGFKHREVGLFGYSFELYMRPQGRAIKEAGDTWPTLMRMAIEIVNKWEKTRPPGCGKFVLRASRGTDYFAQPAWFKAEFKDSGHYVLDEEIVTERGVVTQIYCLRGEKV